ncbi:DUF998 domain-containing protein [Phytomonospora endophytica]|uniref:DUF998 domain-containing protein n=1 Tax=Phytomonospora endophytica TaxID=714109 RepID=A0A841F638_9ACTN|nr:DUF998 domain-containing protein [Phytomonospora endophytica]MBB6032391.1 hypothetical protein [Phytomonospora endophytica]GIG71395.1 hypothetical protein Pen01_76900 [Phytomonospora endophytica]
MTAGMWETRPVPRVATRVRPVAAPRAWTARDIATWAPPRAGIAACFVAMLCMGYLHLAPTHVDALSQPVSSYVGVGGGWLFTIGVTAMAAACFAVAGVRIAMRWAGLMRAVFVIGGLAFLAAAIFPTDVGDVPMTMSAQIHRYAAAVGMGAIPVGGLLLALCLPKSTPADADEYTRRSTGVARRILPLVVISATLLTITATGTFLPDFMHGGDWRGVPQRALLFTEIILVLVIAFLALARERAAAGGRDAVSRS